jgi:hypothetical protein
MHQAPSAVAYFSPKATGRCQANQEEQSSVEQVLRNIEDHHAKYMNSVTRDLKDIPSGFKQFPPEAAEGMTHSLDGKFAPDDSVDTVDFPLRGELGQAKRICPSW